MGITIHDLVAQSAFKEGITKEVKDLIPALLRKGHKLTSRNMGTILKQRLAAKASELAPKLGYKSPNPIHDALIIAQRVINETVGEKALRAARKRSVQQSLSALFERSLSSRKLISRRIDHLFSRIHKYNKTHKKHT